MAMRIKSYESSRTSNPLPGVSTGPLATDSAAFGGSDRTGASIQRFAEAAQDLNESVFDAGLKAQKKAEEDELALKLVKAQQDDRNLWGKHWIEITAEHAKPAGQGGSAVPADGQEAPGVVQQTKEFWDKLAAERVAALGQHPKAARYIVNNWWDMRAKALADAAAYETRQDRQRRDGLFSAELERAAPLLADPATPEETRQALHAELTRKTRAIFGGDAPQLATLQEFQANQNALAQAARTEQHRDSVFSQLGKLPQEEAGARLATEQGRRELGLSDDEANAMRAMLRAKSVFDAEQEEARKTAYAAQLAEKIGDIFNTGTDAGGQPGEQDAEPAPVAAYRLICGAELAPHVKDAALARIMDGSFGKQDDPSGAAALFTGLANGTATGRDLDTAYLTGGISADTAGKAKHLLQTLEGPDGLYYRHGLQTLEQILPPGTPPDRQLNAQNFLLHLVDQAATAERLPQALDPQNPDNAIARSMRLAGVTTLEDTIAASDAPAAVHAAPEGGEVEQDAQADQESLERDSAETLDILTEEPEPLNDRQGTLAAGPGAGKKEALPLSAADKKYLRGTGWRISTDTTDIQDKEYLKKADDLKKKPPQEIQKKTAVLSPMERYNMMANFVYDRGGPKKEKDMNLAGKDKENLTLMLSLQGVSSAVQKRVAAYDKLLEKADTLEKYEKASDEFMRQMRVTDLPQDMQEETTALLWKGAAFVKENAEAIRQAYAVWSSAGSDAEKEQALQKIFDLCAPVFSDEGGTLNFAKQDAQDPHASIDLEDSLGSDNPKRIVTVNTGSYLFEGTEAERFARMAAAMPHELNHIQQTIRLRENRIPEVNQQIRGTNDATNRIIPSSLAVNTAGYISRGASPAGYMAQPLELQSHLLHRDMYNAILDVIGIR